MAALALIVSSLLTLLAICDASAVSLASVDEKDCASIPQPTPCLDETKNKQKPFFFNSTSGICQSFEGCSEQYNNLFATIELCIATCDWFGERDWMLVKSSSLTDCPKPNIILPADDIQDAMSDEIGADRSPLSTKSLQESAGGRLPPLVDDLRRDKTGWTLLHHAASAGNERLVSELVERQGASLMAVTNNRETPLHLAVLENRLDVARKLIDLAKNNSVRQSLVNAEEKCGFTALHFAAWIGNEKMLELLRKSGADVRARSTTRKVPLHLVRSVNTVGFLLPDPKNEASRKELVNSRDAYGRTPIFYAGLLHDDVSLVKRLQKFGALLPQRDIFGMPPMMMAVARNNVKFARYLAAERPAAEKKRFLKKIKCCGYDRNAMHLAARFSALEVVDALLEIGVELNLNETDRLGQSPYCIALSNGNSKIVEFLKSKTVEQQPEDCFQSFLGTVDGTSAMALHEAVRNQRMEVVEFLLAKRASLTQLDEHGQSPLHVASSMRCNSATDTIASSILRATSVDPDQLLALTDRRGLTPLEIAVRQNCIGLVETLLSFSTGKACSTKNKDGLIPADVAKELRFDYLVDAMASSGKCPTASEDDGGCVIRCRDLPEVENGQVAEENNPSSCVSTEVKIICSEGCKLLGTGSAVCQENGRWRIDAYCKQVNPCTDNPILDNGVVLQSTSETSRTFTCKSGYRLTGSPQVTCNDEGEWSFSGGCEKEIDPVPFVLHGSLTGSIDDDKRQLQCDEGFSLLGSDFIQRRSDDKWLVGGFCAPKSCGAPPAIENGAVSPVLEGATKIGDSVIFTCNSGFQPVGSSEIVCSKDCVWLVAGHCTGVVSCGALPELANGRISGNDSNSIGATRLASCNEGFGLTANRTIICQPGGRWSSTSCQKMKFNADIFGAVENGDLQKIRRLVEREAADVNAKRSGDGFSPLTIASRIGKLDVFRLLIDLGAVSDSKTTPLHYASMMGHLELVKWLAANGADVYAKRSREDKEDLPVHTASFMGHVDVVKFFVESFPDLSTAKNGWGGYPIHLAAIGNKIEIVEYFITSGMDVNLRVADKWKRTSLHQAASKGHLDVVKLLVSKEADVYAKSSPEDLESTPIHLAAFLGHVSVVEYFCEKFPNLKTTANFKGQFPIHQAAIGNRRQVVEYFISAGMSLQVRDVGKWKRSSLHYAAGNGQIDLVKWLVSRGADVRAKTSKEDSEYTPIHMAALWGYLEVVRFFIERFPDLKTAKNGWGGYPMHVAALKNRSRIVEYFIERGFDINIRDEGNSRRTALHYAASDGSLDAVKFLVSKGADVDAKSSPEDFESMPIHLAAFMGHFPVVEFFCGKFPNLKTAANSQGLFPIHRAVSGNRRQVVEYFISTGMSLELRDVGKWKRSSLHYAAGNGHVDLVKWLVSRGADVRAKTSKEDLEYMPIHMAALWGYLDVVRFFIERFPDLKTAKNGWGGYPIHVAALKNHSRIVEYFIELGFEINIRDEGNNRRTALHYAASGGSLDAVKLLVSKGADVYAKSSRTEDLESMPIHLAASQGHPTVVKFFCEKFPNLKTAANSEGDFPIHRAALGNQSQVIDYFITSGMDVNVRNAGKWKRASLHHAASKGRLDVVKLLVSKGADVYAKSSPEDFESMPIHLAAYYGYPDVVKFLIKNYPSLSNAKNALGQTPLERAYTSKQAGATEVYNWLNSMSS